MRRVKFINEGVFDGVTTWAVYVDGAYAGDMTRERPTRWHANGVGGVVRDIGKPFQYDCGNVAAFEGAWLPQDLVQPGTTANEAKRIVCAALLEQLAAAQ